MTTLELDHEQQPIPTDRRLVAGRYRLYAKIGRGRLGDIYEADDEGYRELGVGSRVAVQLLPDRIALDQALLGKLKTGYTVLRAGSHPNLVSYYDCDYDGKFGYVAMELLDGASLRFVLDDVSTLPLDEALPVIRAVGDALQFLHGKSMVHGQLSAESVFVTGNLEVHLLDIVPLDSPSVVVRGTAAADSFGSQGVADDIHALACLTYEILSGKHPFNFHSPAEASRAGLEPARISSLSERQWNALQRALSFDAAERPATVRAFLDDLGVTGTERLRPSDPATSPRRPAPAARQSATAPHAAPAAPRVVKRRKTAATRRGRGSRLRPLVLLSLLAGVSAWYFFGQPGDDIASVIGIAEPNSEPVPADREPAAAVATEPAPAETGTAVPAPESPVQPGPERATAESSDPSAAAAVEAPADPAAAAPEPVTAAQDSEAAAQDDAPSETGAQPAAADSRPGNTVVGSLVTVSERDGAARIAFRRPLGVVGTVFWWTGDDTAVADADYIALEQPVVAFDSGEEAETLHVPLVNDSLPERMETFYVFLGQRDVETGRLEPIARVRVNINDDD
jgi:hypothetical protein